MAVDMNPVRVVIASIVAPMAAPIGFVIPILFIWMFRSYATTPPMLPWIALVFIFGTPIAWATMLCVGLPVICILRRLGRYSAFRVILWAAAAPGLLAFTLLTLSNLQKGASFALAAGSVYALLVALSGACAGGVYWAIAHGLPGGGSHGSEP